MLEGKLPPEMVKMAKEMGLTDSLPQQQIKKVFDPLNKIRKNRNRDTVHKHKIAKASKRKNRRKK